MSFIHPNNILSPRSLAQTLSSSTTGKMATMLGNQLGPTASTPTTHHPNLTSISTGPGSRRFPATTNRLLPHDALFNVVVRGQLFKLTYEQITYDQPNLFTAAFLEGFSESNSRTLTIPGRSPVLFGFIYEYLSGYAILPNPTIDLRNLLSDCEYYGLERLKDELTLPRLIDALCSKHELSRVVRLEDLISLQVPDIEWTENGLVDSRQSNLSHLMVYITKVNFKLDLTVRSTGECSHALFAIELPPYARAHLGSKPLSFKDESRTDWTTVIAEALSATPITLNDGEFEGNFGDLVQWVGSFMTRYLTGTAANSPYIAGSGRTINGSQDTETTEKLSKIMPGLSENLKVRALQGQTNLKLSTSFWANDLSIVIAPLDGSSPPHSTHSATNAPHTHSNDHGDRNKLVAKLLNCSLSTGLYRRKCAKALVNI